MSASSRSGSADDPVIRTVSPDGRSLEEQPRWRRDFPIDWSQDSYVARRELVKFIVLTSGAFTAGQGLLVLKSLGRDDSELPPQRIASLEELPIGGSKTFTYPEGSPPRLLVRTGPRSFVAYDQQCTHLLCPVVAAFDQGRLHCPCHNGWFDLESGRPLAGPPRRPLPRINVEVRGEEVFATGVEVRTT